MISILQCQGQTDGRTDCQTNDFAVAIPRFA